MSHSTAHSIALRKDSCFTYVGLSVRQKSESLMSLYMCTEDKDAVSDGAGSGYICVQSNFISKCTRK